MIKKFKPTTPLRLDANSNSMSQAIVFVDSAQKARQSLEPYVNSVVAKFPFIGAFGALINVHKLSDLMTLPCVKAVAPSTNVFTCIKNTRDFLGVSRVQKSVGCGKGVGVAVIDTGLCPHIDLLLGKRVIFKDLVNGRSEPYDDNGHGSAVASILCGTGILNRGQNAGIAPVSNLVSIKAIGAKGEGGAFKILEAMQWIYDNASRCNIRVLCMSFGSEPAAGTIDPLSVGAEALWKKGIVVVASCGNDGPDEGTIKSPGINRHIITVGGVDVRCNGEKCKVCMADFSSRGGNKYKHNKPDLVAPAVDIMGLGADKKYTALSGTSMAAPIVAGGCALLLSKKPNLQPDKVKELLLDNAVQLPFGDSCCGRGLLDLSFVGDM